MFLKSDSGMLKYSIGVAVIIAVIVSVLFNFGVFALWQQKINDAFYYEKSPMNNIVILSIDDKSLQEIGRWPWKREVYEDLLEKVKDAKVIGFDIAFFEKYDSKIDTELGNQMRNLSIVIPVQYTKYEVKGDLISGSEVLLPIEEYSGIKTGFVNIFSDGDGITRSIPSRITGISTEKSFALKISEEYLGREIYVDQNLMINFIGPPNSFPQISISDLLRNSSSGSIDRSGDGVDDGSNNFDFKDKIVLIGATSPGLHDEYFTPFSENGAMSGVEINANAIQTILTKNFLHRQSNLSTFLLIFIISIASALIIATLKLRYSLPALLILFIASFVAANYSFKNGTILNIFYPILSLVLISAILFLINYSKEKLEKQRVKDLFGKYVSKDIAEEIMKTSLKKINLEGEDKEIVVMFADIRGFTTISENMRPKDVVKMLNIYLGVMTEIIFRHRGTLDKYMGDCVMAIFGAPVKLDDPLLCAVTAALEMQSKIKEIRNLGEREVPQVSVGIGLNYGHATVGNIGSVQRVEYTCIGDAVNVASRMCSNALKDQIIVPESFYEMVKDKVVADSLGEIKVKGKAKPISIYNVTGLKK